ncbi:MAG TPA: hypothetical protein VN493_21960 [Thermoanaerobaculia bacterium]|nr:hypothetical protein [Thermoanaerobaculia bacterium]
MSDPLSSSEKERLREAFEESGFELEKGAEPVSRSIGFLAFPGAPNPIHRHELEAVASAIANNRTGTGSDQDAVIGHLITQWENLKPEEMLARYREFALDPYIAVGEWTVPITKTTIESWLRGERLTVALAKRPHLDTRNVEVQQLRIVYVGRDKAVATYHLVETYTDNPMTFTGNGGMILVHLPEGWRIASCTKASEVGI